MALQLPRRAVLAALWGALCLAASSLPGCAFQNIVHEETAPQRSLIVIEDAAGLRTLLFERGGARQSVVKVGDPDHIELPYARTALVALALPEKLHRMLVVGLGGGTLPSFLRRHYPDAAIDVVEIDPGVLDIAKKMFEFREDDRLKVHIADGRRFIEAARPPFYDVIILDAFGSDSIPYHLTTEEFLQGVRRALAPGGVAVGNVWGRSHNRLYDSMLRTYRQVFEELMILDVPGDVNKIFLGLPRRRALSQGELARLAREVSTAGRFRFDLGELVNHGFMQVPQEGSEGQVLRDKPP
jgi:spermidine synthase